MTPLDTAIDAMGGPSNLGAAINSSPQSVSNWRLRGVPAEKCPAIERATNGAVRCEDLRPDVDWAYLRKTNISPDQQASNTESPAIATTQIQEVA